MAEPVVNSFTTCPADCDDDLLYSAIPTEQECADYEQVRSQIHSLWIMPQAGGTPSADPFTNFASATPTATANAINNANTDNTKARYLVGEGGIDAPNENVLEYPLLQDKVTDRDYTLNFTIKNLVQAQYEFLQQVQCGALNFTFYYGSGMGATQWAYGIQGGIVPTKVTVTFPKGAGRDDRDQAVLSISWKATGDPDRRPNPYA